MRILFAGTPETAATVLSGLLSVGHEVIGVLTREDALTGRKKILTASPVAEMASSNSIPVIKANLVDTGVINQISKLEPDLAIVVAYGVILKAEALSAIPLGWFNLHYSVLPMYRGAAPVQHSIMNGEKETGVTLFKIDEGLDTGPILGVVNTTIGPEENSGELLTRLTQLGISLLNEKLPELFSGTFTLVDQTGTSSSAPKVSRADAQLSFKNSAVSLANQVRAMNPEPMAWCNFDEQPMRVLRARTHASPLTLAQGEVAHVEGSVLVGCGNGEAIELLEVQPASKNVMDARAWYNGLTSKTILL